MADMTLLARYASGERHFEDWDLENEDFRQVDLSGCHFFRCYIAADFSHANLSGASFTECNLKTSCFDHAILTHACFRFNAMEGVSLKGAVMEGVVFQENTVYSTVLQQEDLVWFAAHF